MVSSTITKLVRRYSSTDDPTIEATPKVSHTTNVAPSSSNDVGNNSSRLPESLNFPDFESKKNNIDSDSSESSTKYWNYAQDAAEQTYSALSGYMSSVSLFSAGREDHLNMDDIPTTPRNSSNNPSLLTSPTLLNMFQNPYVRVRGARGADKPSSMEAVRTLLSVTAPENNGGRNLYISEYNEDDNESSDSADSAATAFNRLSTSWNQIFFASLGTKHQQHTDPQQNGNPPTASNNALLQSANNNTSENASHLAEGTLRAFRDIALDEAVELHSALKYWSYRWEQPFWSFLEAGPTGKTLTEM
jgi:hypothetical protein